MNSRPLCYNYSDDTEEVTTLSHMMCGRRLISLPLFDEKYDEVESQVTLSKRLKYLKLLIDNYWSRWRTEYLTQLREYQKIRKNSRLIEVGEMVVTFSHELKRNQWKIGEVVKLICGIDNVPRAAILLVKGERCNRYLKRPVRNKNDSRCLGQ